MRGLHHCVIAMALCAIALTGCAPDVTTQQEQTPPEQPETTSLYAEITAAEYETWTPAPGYTVRQAAKGPHGDEVQIFLDATAEKGLVDGGTAWPVGSVIAKDIFRDGDLVEIAAMKRQADGWYWGEWDAQGKPIAEGLAVEPCEGCHADGTDGTLGVTLK